VIPNAYGVVASDVWKCAKAPKLPPDYNCPTLLVGLRLERAVSDSETILWGLVCAAYHLERVTTKVTTELENIRNLLSRYPARTVSTYFLRATITFDPPRSLEAAQALYEHYGVDTKGLEKVYPASKPH